MRRFLFAWIIIVIALAVVGFVHGQPALHQDVGGGTALEGPDSPERAGIGHRPLDFFRLSPRGPSTVIKNRRLWINAGLGPGSIENALHFGLSFSYHHAKKHLISARFIYSTTIDIGLGGLGNDRPDEQIWEIGVLYGKAIRWEAGLASISAGLGKITGIRQGRLIRTHPLGGIFSGGSINVYEERSFNTIGIPVEAQLFFVPHPFFGIGLYGFANLNPELSYGGMLLCLSFGDIN